MSDEEVARRAASLRTVAATLGAALPDVDRLVARAGEALERLRREPHDPLHAIAGGALLHALALLSGRYGSSARHAPLAFAASLEAIAGGLQPE